MEVALLFNSFTFWVFLAIVLFAYHRMGHRSQNNLLLIASYFFYGCWDWRFLSLIALMTVINFMIAIWIERAHKAHESFQNPEYFGNDGSVIESSKSTKADLGTPKAIELSEELNVPKARTTNEGIANGSWRYFSSYRLLVTSIIINLSILAFFKYFQFFSGELQNFLNAMGIAFLSPKITILLPVGISFYIFQTMSYTIDVYRKQIDAHQDLFDFALYVAYFPQLVAGPIERATHLLPQIVSPRKPLPDAFAQGLYLILIGLFKKIFVADSMAIVVNGIFSMPLAELSAFEVLLGTYAFAFQIYGDFSGYSSIAQGVSRWFYIDLMDNFRVPYLAPSPTDFWQRWHISLSQWLRDYLYIPLGGNRYGTLTTYRNLMVTMLLGGLWHGASWTFIAWGAYHGLLLCVYRFTQSFRNPLHNRTTSPARYLNTLSKALHIIFFFHLVCIGWLFFRAESMQQATEMLYTFAGPWRFTPLAQSLMGMILFYVAPLFLFECWENHRSRLGPNPVLRINWLSRAMLYSTLAILMIFFAAPATSQFIYFQF